MKNSEEHGPGAKGRKQPHPAKKQMDLPSMGPCKENAGNHPPIGTGQGTPPLQETRPDRLPQLHDETSVALFLIDTRAAIRDVNAAGVRLLRANRQDLLTTSFLDLISSPQDKHFFSKLQRQSYVTQSSDNAAVTLRRADGSHVPVHLETRVAANMDGTAGFITAAVHDRGDPGAGTSALAGGDPVLSEMPLAFALCEIILNNEGKPHDYRYISVNPAYARMSGTAAEHILARTAREHNSVLDPVWLERFASVALSGGSFQFEHYVAPVKRWFRVWVYCPSPGRFASLMSEVTDPRSTTDKPESACWERILLEQMPHRVFIKDDHSVYLYGNRQFAQDLGIAPEEVPGKTDLDLFPRHVAERYREDDRTLLAEGRVVSREEQYPCPEGVRWVSTLKVPMRGNDRSVGTILGLFSDITERKSAEEELRHGRELYRSLAESGSALVWSSDSEGRTDYVNRLWQQYTGLRLDQMQERGWDRVCHPDDLAQFLALYEEVETKGTALDGEFRFRRSDGEYRWFWTSLAAVRDRSDKVIKRVGTAVDMTERKLAEDALHRNEELLREYVRLLEYAPVMVRTMDEEIMLWNKGMEKIYGYAAADAVGKNAHAFLQTHFTVPLEQITFQLERAGSWEGELRHRAADGRELIVASLWVLHRNLQGQATAIIEINSDITERRRAEEGLRLAHAELERRAAEIDAVNRELEAYTYTVSHDLKAPLCNIEGFTRALLEDYADKLDATGKDYIRRVSSASLRMKQLIDALLNMARVTTGEVREHTVDLSALARVILQDLSHQEPQRKVMLRVAESMSVRGNQAMLQVMLQNLLANAWKFTSKRDQAVIEFGRFEQESRSIFFVRDNGAGFSMEYSDMLFMPFKRFHAKDEFPGIGIGLATAHRIVSRHNGRIWAESAPDEGATFYFTLF